MNDQEFVERLRALSTSKAAGEPEANLPQTNSTAKARENASRAKAFHERVIQGTLKEFAGTVRGTAPKTSDANPSLLVCECEFGAAGARGVIRTKTHVTRDGAMLIDFFLEPWHYWAKNLLLAGRDLEPARDAETRSQVRDRLLDLYEQYLRRTKSQPAARRKPGERQSRTVPSGAA